jgi:hypothetical protein
MQRLLSALSKATILLLARADHRAIALPRCGRIAVVERAHNDTEVLDG